MGVKSSLATFTKSAGTTQYTAGDVIGPTTTPALMNFGSLLPATFIIGATLTKGSTTVATARMRLQLYTGATGPTAIADNSPWTLLKANDAKHIGYIDLGNPVTSGSGSDGAVAQNFDVMMPVIGGGQETGLWGVLEAVDAYTPVADETFAVTLFGIV